MNLFPTDLLDINYYYYSEYIYLMMLNSEAYTFYLEKTANLSSRTARSARCKVAAEEFTTVFFSTADLKSLQKRFLKLVESKRLVELVECKKEGGIREWENLVFYDTPVNDVESAADEIDDMEALPPPPGTPSSLVGRPRKTLADEPCAKRKKNILIDQVYAIEQFAVEQGVSRRDALDMIVERCNKKWKVSKMSENVEVPMRTACAMIYNVNLSVNQYQLLRMLLLGHNVYLPTRNNVNVFKNQLVPDLKVDLIKTACNINQLLVSTSKAILDEKAVSLNTASHVHMIGKFGLDGSGSHQIRHQLAEGLDPADLGTSFIGAFYCPLSISVDGDCIWENPVSNSIAFTRPVCLMRAKETRLTIEEHFKEYTDVLGELNVLALLPRPSNRSFFSFHTEISMIDGKMADILQGDSGSFCHYCKTTRAKANDLVHVLQGFDIEKTYKECEETWDKVESGQIAYSDPARSGQCHEPIMSQDLRFLPTSIKSRDH